MIKSKTKILEKDRMTIIIKILVAIGILTIVPMFNNQMITGPIVNAILFIVTYLFGIKYAMLIGLLPSVVALSVGVLPFILAPMVPFIMLSNAILIVIFDYLKYKNYWLGVGMASVCKFIFLFYTSSVVIDLIVKKQIASKIAIIMGWPQLFTAIAGGIIAYIILKSLGKIKLF